MKTKLYSLLISFAMIAVFLPLSCACAAPGEFSSDVTISKDACDCCASGSAINESCWDDSRMRALADRSQKALSQHKFLTLSKSFSVNTEDIFNNGQDFDLAGSSPPFFLSLAHPNLRL